MNSNTLLIKNTMDGVECSFLKEGHTSFAVVVKDEVLATALTGAGVNGIIEGVDFQILRNTFESFSRRVKARKLYEELSASLPVANAA